MSPRDSGLINLNASPFCPKGWYVREHAMRGDLWRWNPEEVELYSGEGFGAFSGVEEFLKKLKEEKKRPLNARVLDFLLENCQSIPIDWDQVIFLGTIYCNDDGSLAVRELIKIGAAGWASWLTALSDKTLLSRPIAPVFVD